MGDHTGTTETTPAIELVGVRKSFGEVRAVDGVNLVIGEGEFFSLLGPSGSGKTTVLRMIAGFEQPTSGAVLLHGQDVTRAAPYDRDVNTVFQDYALFPHMTVQRNVEYGLRVKGVGRGERAKRAAEMLDAVRLGGYGGRKPNQLSGGQRQRVALARALVNHPKVLLLDEPLGALDLKLREEMQVELKSIQRAVGITFVFVTHDQGEALSMSSRIAVFNQGRIEQVGTPRQIYSRPATRFVAGFVGSSNLLSADLSRRIFGLDGVHSLRPELVHLAGHAPAAEGDVELVGTVTDVQYLGADCKVRVALDEHQSTISLTEPSGRLGGIDVGDQVTVVVPRGAAFQVADDITAVSAHEAVPVSTQPTVPTVPTSISTSQGST